MKSKIKKIISITLIVIATILFALSLYIKNKFGDAKIEQLLLSLMDATGTSNDVIIDGIKYCLPIVLILSIVLVLPIFIKHNKDIKLKIFLKRNKKKNFKIKLFPIPNIIYSVIIFIILVIYSFNSMGAFEYINNQIHSTKIFDDYYVNPSEVSLTFPKEKQNLIYIYMESMEMDYSNFNIDGEEVNLIPGLEKIAQKNLNFSNTNSLGGAQPVYGTGWTIAGVVAQSAGIPLKLVIDGNLYDHYNGFLPGVTTLGDILEEEGYKQVYLIGSDASFAGRDLYYTNHGNYEILDLNWAKQMEKISEDYFVFWGYEDNKLFEYAKEELLELAKSDKPFNFTMLTVDTHAIDGYLDESCDSKYDYQYANVISCSDGMITNFINWIMKQDFYENTTIILAGDHLSMQSDVVEYVDKDSRVTYNVIINSQSKTTNNKNRIFTSFDMFPTTLASLGVKIEGDRLGLGTNLYSDKKTLAEELGMDYLNSELAKTSNYYNEKFLENTYLEMLQDI